jgi:hypothetical protein
MIQSIVLFIIKKMNSNSQLTISRNNVNPHEDIYINEIAVLIKKYNEMYWDDNFDIEEEDNFDIEEEDKIQKLLAEKQRLVIQIFKRRILFVLGLYELEEGEILE